MHRATFDSPVGLHLTSGDVHVLLDALISYDELSRRIMLGEVLPPLNAPNVPQVTLANVAELYARIAGQLGGDYLDVRYSQRLDYPITATHNDVRREALGNDGR